ncbi:Reverse transcriptase-RNase H-integrase [Mycena kentingensis (nom. inval.)]|nr:Reverse transcriptase-RNase H-integrase [Mycena kentingensis (nom. inval.)]
MKFLTPLLNTFLPPAIPSASASGQYDSFNNIVRAVADPLPLHETIPNPSPSPTSCVSSLVLPPPLMSCNNENLAPGDYTYPTNPKPGHAYIIVRGGGKLAPGLVGGKGATVPFLKRYEGFVSDHVEYQNVKSKDIVPKLIRGLQGGRLLEWADNLEDPKALSLDAFIEQLTEELVTDGWSRVAARDLSSIKLSQFPSCTELFDALLLARHSLKGTDDAISDEGLIKLATSALDDAEFVALLNSKAHKSAMAALTSRPCSSASSPERFASLASGSASSSSKRSLPDADRDSKRGRASTFVAATGTASFSSSFTPAVVKLPAAVLAGKPSYANRNHVGAFVYTTACNERGNTAIVGGCMQCREPFVYHQQCGKWPDVKTYVVLDNERRDKFLAALTPAQRADHDRWTEANKDDIERRSVPPLDRKASRTAVAAAVTHDEPDVVMSRFDEIYDDDDSVDDIGNRSVSVASILPSPSPPSPLPSSHPLDADLSHPRAFGPCPSRSVSLGSLVAAARAEPVVGHFVWNAIIDDALSHRLPAPVQALIDNGSGLDLIDPSLVSSLSLPTYKLKKPIPFGLAVDTDAPPLFCTHFVKLRFLSPDSQYTSRTVRALVAPHRLCYPVLLGLMFLRRNRIVIDHGANTVVDPKWNFDLMHPKPLPPKKKPRKKLTEIFKEVQAARRNVAAELKSVCAHYLGRGRNRVAKFLARQEGPYAITAVHPECSTVTLDLVNQPRVHPVFHVAELTPYRENDPILFPDRQLTKPGPIVGPDGEEEYFIERVLDKRVRYRKTQYKIRWRGYGPEDDDWIDADELEDSAHVEAFDAGRSQDDIPLEPSPDDDTPANTVVDETPFAHIEPLSREPSPVPEDIPPQLAPANDPPLQLTVAKRILRPRNNAGKVIPVRPQSLF